VRFPDGSERQTTEDKLELRAAPPPQSPPQHQQLILSPGHAPHASPPQQADWTGASLVEAPEQDGAYAPPYAAEPYGDDTSYPYAAPGEGEGGGSLAQEEPTEDGGAPHAETARLSLGGVPPSPARPLSAKKEFTENRIGSQAPPAPPFS
jgi:hypothetical protein